MNPLERYLREYGLLLCNQNPELPALEDIGAGWQDVTALIDAHRLFYSKATGAARPTCRRRSTAC